MDGVAAISANDLYRFYHTGDTETRALRGVSLEIGRGELVAVMGPSGSGKSSLLACLAGIDEPDGGYVDIGGSRMTRRIEADRARLRARKIGVLMQSGNMLDQLTVQENLELARKLAGRTSNGIRTFVAMFGVEHRLKALPPELSGGELARASLALALINDPDVVLADEPTGEVDAGNEARMLEFLVELASSGRAIVVVTHSPVVAARANRVLHLADGRFIDA